MRGCYRFDFDKYSYGCWLFEFRDIVDFQREVWLIVPLVSSFCNFFYFLAWQKRIDHPLIYQKLLR